MKIQELKEKTDELINQYCSSLKANCNTYSDLEISIENDIKSIVYQSKDNLNFANYVKKELDKNISIEKNALSITK